MWEKHVEKRKGMSRFQVFQVFKYSSIQGKLGRVMTTAVDMSGHSYNFYHYCWLLMLAWNIEHKCIKIQWKCTFLYYGTSTLEGIKALNAAVINFFTLKVVIFRNLMKNVVKTWLQLAFNSKANFKYLLWKFCKYTLILMF